MSKLNELKNALKLMEQAEVGETLLELVRQEIVKAEEMETADNEVRKFREWKLRVIEGRSVTMTPWYMLQESSRDSWRDAYRSFSEYFGPASVDVLELKNVNSSPATDNPYFEIEDAGSDAQDFQFHIDLSFGIHADGTHHSYQFSDAEFDEFVKYVNWVQAERNKNV